MTTIGEVLAVLLGITGVCRHEPRTLVQVMDGEERIPLDEALGLVYLTVFPPQDDPRTLPRPVREGEGVNQWSWPSRVS